MADLAIREADPLLDVGLGGVRGGHYRVEIGNGGEMRSEIDRLRPSKRSLGTSTFLGRHELFVVVAFAAAITCFVGSTAYLEWSLNDITDRSELITEALLPRLIDLFDMRADLMKVARTVNDAPRPAELRPNIAAVLDHAEASRRRYEATASGPQLSGPWHGLRAALGAVGSEAIALSARQEHGEPLDDVRANFYSWLDRADASLIDVMLTNRDEAERNARQVDILRRRLGRNAYALDTLSVLIAGALLAHAVGLLRRRRLAMETRVDELETFVARVAHDVRTPLAPAMFALQQALARTSDSPLRGQIERGARSLHTIERIVSGLFAFAASGAAPEAGASASLRETLEEVITERIDSASARGIELSLDCSADAHLACSAGVLASVVGNLLDNALKYVGDGEQRHVDVRSFLYTRKTRIEVSDTGPGIPPGDRMRIFEPYVRTGTGGSGIGLGLATVKRLVTRHGGQVGVTGARGGGSTFWVELPLSEPREIERSEPNRPTEITDHG